MRAVCDPGAVSSVIVTITFKIMHLSESSITGILNGTANFIKSLRDKDPRNNL